MKKNIRSIAVALVVLVLVCAGLFWAIRPQPSPAIQTSDPTALELEDLTPLSVPLLSEEACSTAAQEMVSQLPDSPIIAQVSSASAPMSYGSDMVQRFYVDAVYAGEGLEAHTLIWLTSSQWQIQKTQTSGSLQTGYVNLPQNHYEYLVFLQDRQEDAPTIYDQPVYQLRDDLTLTPVLCRLDWNAQVDPDQGESGLFQDARWHEFYAQTQQGMDTLMEAKHQVMEQFPLGE